MLMINVMDSFSNATFAEYEKAKVLKRLFDNDFDFDTKDLVQNSNKLICLFDEWNTFEVFGETDSKYFLYYWYTTA